MKIDKKEFRTLLEGNLRILFRKDVKEASKQQCFQALAVTVRDYIMDAWLATSKKYKEDNVKFVYYMSMEFLMGRALGNNIINKVAFFSSPLKTSKSPAALMLKSSSLFAVSFSSGYNSDSCSASR